MGEVVLLPAYRLESVASNLSRRWDGASCSQRATGFVGLVVENEWISSAPLHLPKLVSPLGKPTIFFVCCFLVVYFSREPKTWVSYHHTHDSLLLLPSLLLPSSLPSLPYTLSLSSSFSLSHFLSISPSSLLNLQRRHPLFVSLFLFFLRSS